MSNAYVALGAFHGWVHAWVGAERQANGNDHLMRGTLADCQIERMSNVC